MMIVTEINASELSRHSRQSKYLRKSLSLQISPASVGLYVSGYNSEKPNSLLTYLCQGICFASGPGFGVGVCPHDSPPIAMMNAPAIVTRLTIDTLLKTENEDVLDGGMSPPHISMSNSRSYNCERKDSINDDSLA